jgi:transposase-like protein
MIARRVLGCQKRESDDGDQLPGSSLPKGYHSHRCALVCGIFLELSACRSTLGGARVPIDHATSQRWVVTYSPLLEEAFHRRKRSVWVSWRIDEIYIQVKGQWCYLYRAVDKTGQTIDFLLTKDRDE